MFDSFSLAIPADPAPCRAAADGLRALARSADEAGDHLDTQVALPPGAFSGATARAYHGACGELRADVRLLAQVRRRAVAERLLVSGDEIGRPECPDTAQAEAFRILLGLKNRAHLAAGWVYSDWMSALERHTGAAPTGPISYPPLGSWPPGPGHYPYDAGIPGRGPGPLAPREEPPAGRGEDPAPRGEPAGDGRPQDPPPPASAPPPPPAPAEPSPQRGDDPPDPVPVAMTPGLVASLPALLLLPDPAAHGRCPTGFDGVLT